MDHFEKYMNDLKRVRDLNFDKCFLVHTLGLDPTDLVVDAKKKISEYINYREIRLKKIYKDIQVCYYL